jgi:hypothetical protein
MSERHYSQERCELANCYPGRSWAKKVANMSDGQVHEVLVSIRKRQEEAKKACKKT